jgi:predicted AAA+ superfamily ATPase
MEFGPFPEPLLSQNRKKARLWRRTRVEAIIRQDLRDLTRIPELSRIEMLAALIPDRVGSPCSVASLREDLEVSHNTAKRWLALLQELYYLYELKPYQRRIQRSLKKEGKVYLWDWREVDDRGARFENLVAGHLLKACHFWTDTGEGNFELFYLRNKEKQEIDFLVTRDGDPWLPVEAKLSDPAPSPNWRKFLPMLPCHRALQLVAEPGAWREHVIGEATVLVASAGEALSYFV